MLSEAINSKAQSISEYVLLVGIIGAVLLGMQTYMKRGIQAAIKVAADQIGRQEDSEERDPLKGIKSEVRISMIGRGAPANVTSADGTSVVLPQGASQRTYVCPETGRQERYTYSISEMGNVTVNGTEVPSYGKYGSTRQ